MRVEREIDKAGEVHVRSLDPKPCTHCSHVAGFTLQGDPICLQCLNRIWKALDRLKGKPCV